MNSDIPGSLAAAAVLLTGAYVTVAIVMWIRAEIAERKWRREQDKRNV